MKRTAYGLPLSLQPYCCPNSPFYTGTSLNALFFILWIVLSLGAAAHLLLYKREPSSTIAWLFFVVTVPIFGPIVFFIFGPQRLERQAYKRSREIERLLGTPLPLASPSDDPSTPPQFLSRDEAAVLLLAKQISQYSVTSGNRVEIFSDPYQAWTAIQEAIAGAQSFIHLEYYIFESDEVTGQLFEALTQAVKRGVEIRVLYDALGSLFLKKIFFRNLQKQGVRVAGFLPFSLLPQRMNFNFRNHRKILIIDGKVCFTGGTNIGKKYLGRLNETQWLDYTVRVQGSVCQQLQDVFAKDWQFTTQEDLFRSHYYPASEPLGDASVQVLESGPDSTFLSLHQAIFLAINLAQQEILLTTPYFIPDPAISTSLMVAARRGVHVRILLPHQNDSPLVQYASRSFYDDLLSAGIEIYEYLPKILHAKLIVIDEKWTILGSANMDIRSFKLNFELNLLVYGLSLAKQAKNLFEKELKNSMRVSLESFIRRPLTQQLLENMCRLLSPIL